ncbi:metallophosphoesterase [Sphingobium sp. CFD-2]|uniref:metallophosphoesterase n=1 Tax=Sphingobium sp. CFD-2 TaxID=2878542 RepID=UPI00214AA0C9|nr:metallophosphoesterase [Sphingobium sp. CFD-2]
MGRGAGRRWRGALLLPVAIGSFALWLVSNARAMPVVRQLEIALPFPPDAAREPVTVALVTDTHVGPENSPARMARIVEQVNGLKPDLIVLGGDYIADAKGGGAYGPVESIAAFARLRARLGVVAVLGNHDSRDHSLIDREQWRKLFGRMGIQLLDNQAVRRGPLSVGGLRDIYTGKPDIPRTFEEMRRLGGAPLILSHGPDVFPQLPDQPLLTLVGHTHCGQVAFPFLGILNVPSHYGTRYACGVYREGARTMVVSGGVGTSRLPIRMLAPPDLWLITIRPQ